MINMNKPYLSGEDVSEALIKAGIETTPETTLAYLFNDVAGQLTRLLNQRMLYFLQPVTEELELRAGHKPRREH